MASSTGADAEGWTYLRRTTYEHEAAEMLKSAGYAVFRTDGRQPGVNLIGMADRDFRFVCIRRRRAKAGRIRQVATEYTEDLKELRRYISAVVTAELWILVTGDGWRRFRVYPGGIQEIGGAGHA